MRILVTGASGLLGNYLLQNLSKTDHRVTAWSGSQPGTTLGFPVVPVPLTDADAVRQSFLAARPDLIVHAAAMASVAKCFKAPELAWRVNAEATRGLVGLTAQLSARLLLVSTDLVFDGRRGGYREPDEAQPLSIYGRTKLAAEEAALSYGRAAVVRVSLLFGPALGERRSFFDEQVAAIKEARPCTLFSDEWRTPLALSTAASALIQIAESDFTGRLHLGGPERMSRLEMGERLARVLGREADSLVAVTRDSATADEPRPRDSSLDSSLWRSLFPRHPWPSYEEAQREMMP
ncbi:MAG TPA: SDR family oxidoreductase [Pirellulales bacterium]|jgi:dTDP-4-dehydrorhamnose reductase|nr:SDR family oxidoreductase [Pirellulales bacterium]